MIGERRDKRERTHKRRTKTQLLLSLSLSLLISPSYRLFSFSPSSSRQMMMMMVQNCRGNNRTAPSFCFAGAGERLETFFSFWSASFFIKCEANLSQTPLASFPSRLFKETFPQSCHVCPFGRYFKTLFAFAFLFRTFFFAFSSRCELSPRRGIPYSYRAHISLYIFLFKVAQKSFSHHAGARKERLRVVFGRHRPSLVACWRRYFFNKMIG